MRHFREMEKIHYQDDHQAVIAAAGGMRFQLLDRGEGMSKSASEAIDRKTVQSLQPDDDHFAVHLIAMGSDESVGPNRNGDGWPEKALKQYHPTFTKLGCFFREHRNRNQQTQGIGLIKHAAYNDTMSRVELVIWGNKRKAEEEYEMAKAGKELSFSMSARMPYDTCSICRKRSKRQEDYCTDLKERMLQYDHGMRKYAYAINDTDLKFFDISRVKKPADRIAHYISYTFPKGSEMAKAASAGSRVITGADWAAYEGVDLSGGEMRFFTPWEEGTLKKLAAAERAYNSGHPVVSKEVIDAAAPRSLPQKAIDLFSTRDFALVAGELAKKAMILDFASFASMVTRESVDDLFKNASFMGALESCGTMFEDMEAAGGCNCGDAAMMVTPDEFGCSLDPNKDPIDRMIAEVSEDLGMDQGRVEKRAHAENFTKRAGVAASTEVDPFYQGLREAYGYYVVKAAHQVLEAKGVSANSVIHILPAMNRATA